MHKNRLQHGVTLLEALIAMLVLALGMLSYSAVDTRLRSDSDIAKQRSEAVRIAQEDMENFRAFGSMTVDGTMLNNLAYDSIVSTATPKTVLAPSSIVTTTNATYTITRNIVSSSQPGMKDLRIQVGWNDRRGNPQQVALRSVVARVDPILAAGLAIIPNDDTQVRGPFGRDVTIPIPAKDLGDGRSVFKPVSNGTLAYLFNNVTGEVIGQCTVSASTSTLALTSSDVSSCASISAYLLSGFIRFSYQQPKPDATNPNDGPPPGTLWSIRLDLSAVALPAGAQGTGGQLTPSMWPTVAGPTGTVPAGYTTAPQCNSENLKTIRYTTSTGEVVLIVPAGVALTASAIAPYADPAATVLDPIIDTGERYVGYTCVVFPIDLDADPSTPPAWTGRATLWPTGAILGTAVNTYKVCRYSSDYNLNGYVSQPPPPYIDYDPTPITKIDNPEHPYAYLNASSGLNSQNYLVVAGNQNCPTDGDVEVNGQGKENYTNETTVLHQP